MFFKNAAVHHNDELSGLLKSHLIKMSQISKRASRKNLNFRFSAQTELRSQRS